MTAAAAASKPTPSHSLLIELVIEVGGVILFSVLAGTDDNLATILVIIMWGILLLWMITHTSQLSSLVGNL